VNYTRKDGTIKSVKDFRLAEEPVSVLFADMRRDLPKLLAHHDEMQWQGRDLIRFKRKLFLRGSWSSTQDFSQNGTLEPKY
jgi:hypothetical protein